MCPDCTKPLPNLSVERTAKLHHIEKGRSMKRSLLAVAFLCGGLVSYAPVGAQEKPAPITVFVAKKIITMDPGWPTATAVAVRDGKILSVGSLKDLKPWLESAPHKIDRRFAEKILTPGMIEPHGHPVLGGTSLTRPLLSYLPIPSPYGPPFPGITTPAAALAKLKEYVSQAKSPDETVLTWGYDVIAMGGTHLDKTILDKVSATQPILVWDASEHFVYANSAALRKYKIAKEHLKTNGVMAGADGEPNGQFLGTTAAQLVLAEPLTELFAPEVALKNVKFLMDLSRQNGVTTTSELAFGAINLPVELQVFDVYFNSSASPMRCVVVADATTIAATKGEGAVGFVQSLTVRSTDKLMFNGVKFFSDDSFLSLGMVMENPGYTDGRNGIFILPPDKMVETWLPWWKAGFQIHVHTNGNGGNEATLRALEGLMQAHPRFGHRFTFTHYGMSTPDQAKRIAAVGGITSVNPYYLYSRSEFNAPYVGADRAYTAARLKTLVDAGVPTSLHTDTPVAPPSPLEAVWIAVNRFGLSGKVRGPEERISVHQALRMVTIDAAHTLGVEDKVGSIVAGKFADFAVLENDPYAVPKEKIRDIKVWGTVVGGVVFPASEIKP